jgi:hypothetical protein
MNHSPKDSMKFVKITSFYDDAGKVVGTDFTYSNVRILRTEETSSFNRCNTKPKSKQL